MQKTIKFKFDFILILLVFVQLNLYSQQNVKWDDTKSKQWPDHCEKIGIISSVDGKEQPAWFYKSKSKKNRPLIISLHTWSGGYNQKDTLSWQCIDKDYNYIHPHFRGPNHTYDACGSAKVIADIEDAIDYAIDHANIDTNDMHIIGVSGGGYATLLMYMKTRHKIKSFSAWAPISNLMDWYYESEGRKNKYSKDIAQATTGLIFDGDHYYMNEEEAKKRSPAFMITPVEQRMNSKLFIFAGVHDGYTGSVPITQSVDFYNKLVKNFDSNENEAIVPESDKIKLLAYRGFPADQKDSIGDRLIHYRKSYQGKIQITIFEGTHEMLTEVALDPVQSKNILVIGDSNGKLKNGWVNQLQKLRFEDRILNTSVSGNTIGFDNSGYQSLNTLRNIDAYLNRALQYPGKPDAIVIMLGTNDCKKVFEDSLKLVAGNMMTLINKIKSHPVYLQCHPQIYMISPPPFGPDQMLKTKYKGGSKRIEYLIPELKKIARKEDCIFVDTYSKLKDSFRDLSSDGVHLTSEGQTIIASILNEIMKKNLK